MTLTAPTKTGSETTLEHTGLLRMGLAEPESREYWRQSQRNLSPQELTRVAFEERWFGSRTMTRVHYLMVNFQARFGAFPMALKALHHWNPEDPAERRIVCHWHLQLNDPLYRSFTSTHLPERLQHPQPTLDRNAVLRWVEDYTQHRMSAATTQRLAGGLTSCLNEVGFTNKATGLRPLCLPRVSDRALGYALYLLRETEYVGTLSQNPYLSSLGLSGEELEERLSRVPGIEFRKMSNVKDLHWKYADLWEWAQAEL